MWLAGELISLFCQTSTCALVPLRTNATSDTFIIDKEDDSLSTKLDHEIIEYIAGYVAYKLRVQHPQLHEPHSSGRPDSWINQASRGMLLHPTTEWLALCLKLEHLFREKCGEGLLKLNSLGTLHRSIPKEISMPDSACKLYLRVRFYHRLKSLNEEHRAQQIRKRKRRKVQHSSK